MATLLQFVDSITSSPSVRLNPNDGSTWKNTAEGTSFPPAPLRRAVASTLLADGGRVTAAAYDNRVLRLRLVLRAASPDAQATQIQALARELDRPSNILKWQPDGATNPVFFRTFRSDIAQLDRYLSRQQVHTVELELLAEPFALGLKEALGGTLNANPYFETNALNWSLANHGTATFVRSTAQFHEGAASGLLTPDGVAASPEVRCENVAVTSGLAYRVSVWVRCAAARTITVGIIWRDSAGVFMSSSTVGVAVAATTWTLLQTAAVAPASTAFANLTVQMGGTPPGSALLHIDEATIAQSFTVNNDPAATVNGMFFDVVGVKGDVETPLHLAVGGSIVVSPNQGPRQTLVAPRRRGTPSQAPLALQCEAMTMGTDTTTQPNNAAFSGSGNNFTRTTFATAALVSRLSTSLFPAAAGIDVRGRYNVYLRYRLSTLTINSMAVQLWWGTSNGAVFIEDKVPLLNDGGGAPALRYAYLGEVQIPPGYDPVSEGPAGVEIATEGVFLRLDAERTSGTASLDMDFLLLVPADDRTLLAKWPGHQVAPTDLVLDSEATQVYARNASGQIAAMPGAQLAGAAPMVSPGVTNRIYWVRDVGPDTSISASGTGDDITATTTITPYYWPRYLYVRPAST